ncbi:MAG TPA: TIGR01458 family HAD-type hydrolase [Gemmatimonadaceae bacterium]
MPLDALLLDLDGTLYVGDAPLPGAVDAIRTLAARNLPRRYLTNTTRLSRRALAERLTRMGFPIEQSEIFTPSLAAARWLATHDVERVALYLPEGARDDFAAFRQSDVAPQAVVVGDLGRAWDFATLDRAFRQLMAGAMLVALQKNRFWLTPDGLSLDAGPFVAALEYASGQDAVVVGKPNIAFFELAAAFQGAMRDRARIAVVGDDVEVDVGGAQAAGMRGVLVRTGKFQEDVLRRSAVHPDWIIDSVADVGTLL